MPLFVQTNFIAYHGNKFTVRRLAAQVVDRITKVAVQRVHVAAVPSDLDGVAIARSTRLAVVMLRLAISG